MLLIPSICHEVRKGDRLISNTRDFREEVCEKIALPHAPKLPLLSDLTNFKKMGPHFIGTIYSTAAVNGLKLVHLRQYLTERDEYDGSF